MEKRSSNEIIAEVSQIAKDLNTRSRELQQIMNDISDYPSADYKVRSCLFRLTLAVDDLYQINKKDFEEKN